MWWGDAVYFTSDREKTLNLWRSDLETRETRKLTSFTEFDVLWPSLGDGKIVFMNGGVSGRKRPFPPASSVDSSPSPTSDVEKHHVPGFNV